MNNFLCGQRIKTFIDKESYYLFSIDFSSKLRKPKTIQTRKLGQDSLMNFLYLGIRRSFLDWLGNLNGSLMAFSLEDLA